MGQFVKETAHKQYIGNKKFQDNWEHIFRKPATPTENKEQEQMEQDTETLVAEPEISLAEMDSAIAELKKRRTEYEEAHKISTGLHEAMKQQEAVVVAMLEKADKTVYIAEGIGRVKVTHEMSVQTPKTPEDKKAFFNWLSTNLGQDVADAYQTVNSQSLNSLYNELEERFAREGKVLSIDGLGQPIARTKLSLTKA